MAIGATLKLIRTGKGLSQREFSKGVISNSYYSKVEAGESQLSADSLFELLEQANVTLSEFYFINKKYKGEEQTSLFTEIKLKLHLQNKEGLEEIYQRLQEEEIEEVNYLYILNNLIRLLENEPLEQEEINAMKSYLYDVPSWGHFEFQLFSLCTTLLDVQTLLRLSVHVIRNLEKYAEYANYEQDMLMILTNLVRTCTLENQLEEADYFLNMAKRVNKNPVYVYEKLNLTFFEGLLKIKKGEFDQGLLMSSDVVNIFQTIDMPVMSQRLNKLLSDVIED